MGNPHIVIFTDDTEKLPIEKIGPKFEFNALFPERVNTEFCHDFENGIIKMRVWERGSGETLACGTGACASAVAAVLNGKYKHNEKITLSLIGGTLAIVWKSNGNVIMSGPAEFVFDGEIEI